jgi:hypothetical protein
MTVLELRIIGKIVKIEIEEGKDIDGIRKSRHQMINATTYQLNKGSQ